ncbi:MAG: peptide-methionine (S)-S-oxide reductase MsrA [Bacteroidota bacterium]
MKNVSFSLAASLMFFAALFACGTAASSTSTQAEPALAAAMAPTFEGDSANLRTAILAGGCFWCTEAQFERIQGVVDVVSGYSGGTEQNPTYEQVSNKMTSHAEAVRVLYDTTVISYQELLEIFFVGHDPTTLNRQGPDVGPQYRSAIYYKTEGEKAVAEAYIEKLNQSGKFARPIVTEVTEFTSFWMAEDYHQDFYELHPNQRYVYSVSRPKVEKVKKAFKDKLKPQYQ